MTQELINFKDKFSKFSEHWSPRVIAEMNDYQFKLAKIQNEFVWHDHKDTDEVFIVIEGSMGIEFRDKTVLLNEGEMFVVPKGVEHKPFAQEECKVMFVEPRGVKNTGETSSELTAENDVWV
ncbi:cupin domain-containing protein [Marinomonas agarivorans]|nr:cupin domain-containing protein [Marinomonas agarivorans]